MKRLRIISVLVPLLASLAPSRAQPTATTYEYDSLGNRLTGTGLIRQTDSRVFSFQPSTALHGQPVNVFGRSLPVAAPEGIEVTIGAVFTTIISVAPNVITITVPDGATTGPLVVTLPGQAPVDLGTLYIEGIVLSPRVTLITFSQTMQFTADVFGVTDESVTWSLAPGTGCSASNNLGEIDTAGRYTPPPATDLNLCVSVLVKATSVELPRLKATAQVIVFGTTANANVPQVLAPGVNADGDLAMSPFVSQPPISILVPSFSDIAGLLAGVTVASPPVSIVLIGTALAGDLAMSPTVAWPPVQIVLPAFSTEAGEVPLTPTIANPPVEIEWQDNP